ncbi:MAG: hypothetical protein ACKVJ1_06270 [Verrucomicrobiia bacterium]|jgi:hypothetical protein|tara:strand:- start:1058 stop:1261 length:204 start_codon:yes stop_codon:yes gene_type:complete
MKQDEDEHKDKPLDDLLSLRGKPFTDWKEERKYLREKWGMQGRQVLPDFSDSKKKIVEPKHSKEKES